MFVSELKEVAKDGYTRDLRQVLDLCNIRAIEVTYGEEYYRDDGDADCLVTHAALERAGGSEAKTR